MKIKQIIESLDDLDIRRINDRRYYARFAQFLADVREFLNVAFIGNNEDENINGDLHIEKASILIKPYVTPERTAKLCVIADYFSKVANQRKYLNALMPSDSIAEKDSNEMEYGGLAIPVEYEEHICNVGRSLLALLDLCSGAQVVQEVPTLTAFIHHLDKVFDFLENQEREHGVFFTTLKSDLTAIKVNAAQQQLFHPPVEGPAAAKALRQYQKQCDHAMLKAIHQAKREAGAPSLVMRILDAVRRLFKEHIPKLLNKISGIKPVTPLYEYRFFAVRNNSERPWLKKMEIIAQSHDRFKTPEIAA